MDTEYGMIERELVERMEWDDLLWSSTELVCEAGHAWCPATELVCGVATRGE